MSLDDVKTATLIVKALGILGAQHGIVEGTLGAGTDVRQIDDVQKRRSLTVGTFYVVDSREYEIVQEHILIISLFIVLISNGYIQHSCLERRLLRIFQLVQQCFQNIFTCKQSLIVMLLPHIIGQINAVFVPYSKLFSIVYKLPLHKFFHVKMYAILKHQYRILHTYIVRHAFNGS